MQERKKKLKNKKSNTGQPHTCSLLLLQTQSYRYRHSGINGERQIYMTDRQTDKQKGNIKKDYLIAFKAKTKNMQKTHCCCNNNSNNKIVATKKSVDKTYSIECVTN